MRLITINISNIDRKQIIYVGVERSMKHYRYIGDKNNLRFIYISYISDLYNAEIYRKFYEKNF